MGALVVVTTVGTEEQANLIARELVCRRHAACVNIVPGLRSVYRWQGKVCRDTEFMLIVKTQESEYAAVEGAIRELHSYELPEILGFKVGNDGDLDKAAAFLSANGIPPAFVEQPFQGRTLQFTDPFGFRIELYASCSLVKYLGLNPALDESGSGKWEGGIGGHGRRDLRSLLVEVSWTLLRKKDGDPLARWARQLARRRGPRRPQLPGSGSASSPPAARKSGSTCAPPRAISTPAWCSGRA